MVKGHETLGKENPTGLAAINRLLLTESDAGVRLEMARYLGQHLQSYPEARRTLKYLVLSDPSLSVRKLAFQELSTAQDK